MARTDPKGLQHRPVLQTTGPQPVRPVLTAACVAVLGLCAFLAGSPKGADKKYRLLLVDAETGKAVGGMVRIKDAESGEPIKLTGLLDRLRGFAVPRSCGGWHVVPVDGGETVLPRRRLQLEALHGVETALVQQELDLGKAAAEDITIKLPFLFRPDKLGLVAGNTHLHLLNMTRAEADSYLRTIPAADGLKVMFISYLERHKDDQRYITNSYPIGALPDLAGSGVVFANGEEHRHNFPRFGIGYGHVMLLGIKELVKPVSLGPALTKAGNDDRPLRTGIEEARRQGGTVIWCHNTYGHEVIPGMLAGRLDAINFLDNGSRCGSLEDLYYRFLNLGLRVPLSTGTDWFLYDFSRVYARLGGPVSTGAWLTALKRGEAVITNGPLLTLTVDEKPVGAVLDLEKPRKVRVDARAVGRLNFDMLQLVRNGVVVHTQTAQASSSGFTARIAREVGVDGPAWFAVRIIESARKNEFGQRLFAHSSPVYVDVAGGRVFDVEAALDVLRLIETAQGNIRARGVFSSPAARDKLLALYDQAATDLRDRMKRRGK
jgi:hypothetical protein